MHTSVSNFAKTILTADRISGKRVLEVGSFNVNGSIRDIIRRHDPSSYTGIDIQPQDGYVDLVLDAGSIVSHFGSRSFDVVICAEVLEHVENWMEVASQMSAVLNDGGLLFVTTRSKGFPLHGFPSDHWRYTTDDLAGMFPEFGVAYLGNDPDPERPGVFFVGFKNKAYAPAPSPSIMEIGYHEEPSYNERMTSRRLANRVPENFKTFYHVACMGNWIDVFNDQMALMDQVGISPACHVVGTESDFLIVRDRIPSASWHGQRITQYETPTLQAAHEWASANPLGALLYLHTKGVSQPQDEIKKAWRILMEEALVSKWRDNLTSLAEFDMVGVNWIHSHSHPHYSGNFWMARCDWIASLPSPNEHQGSGGPWIAGHPWERMHAEMWLGCRPWHHMKSLVCENETLWTGSKSFDLLDQRGRDRLSRFNQR